MAASISVVIITKNEEANIRRCLESVHWASEIVVVDSGSTDRTVEVCEELGCRVFARHWDGYASQKNFAISQATGDWILSLDADEEVTPELGAEISRTLGSGVVMDGYTMPRRNLFLGKWLGHGGWYPDRQLRLWRRGIGEFKDVPIHEHVIFPGLPVRIGRLASAIRHYTYPTVADFLRKADIYTSIVASKSAQEAPRQRVSGLSLLAATHGKFVEAYIYKAGWRDGAHGFIAATLLSARVLIRWVKTWEAIAARERESGAPWCGDLSP